MQSRDFVFWLQGLFEGNPDLKQLDETQTATVVQHLALVFRYDASISSKECEHDSLGSTKRHQSKQTGSVVVQQDRTGKFIC